MNLCRLEDLSGWLEDEAALISNEAHRRVILEVNANLDSFVKWPKQAILWWDGCQYPEGAFNATQDEYGFMGQSCGKVWHSD